jgi:hypothetical protein
MATTLAQLPVQSGGSFGQCAAFWGTQTCAHVAAFAPDPLPELLLLQPASAAPASAATTQYRRIDILDLPLNRRAGTPGAADCRPRQDTAIPGKQDAKLRRFLQALGRMRRVSREDR